MQFIRGHDSECRISILPPELVADGDHLDRVFGSCGLLYIGNYSRRRHEQCHNDKDRDYGPGELDLITAIHLRRFAPVVIGPLSEFHDRVSEQSKHDHEYGCRHGKHKDG